MNHKKIREVSHPEGLTSLLFSTIKNKELMFFFAQDLADVQDPDDV